MSEEVVNKLTNSRSVKIEPGEVAPASTFSRGKTSRFARSRDVITEAEKEIDMSETTEKSSTKVSATGKRFPRILAELDQLQAELETEVKRLKTEMNAVEDELAQVREARSVLGK